MNFGLGATTVLADTTYEVGDYITTGDHADGVKVGVTSDTWSDGNDEVYTFALSTNNTLESDEGLPKTTVNVTSTSKTEGYIENIPSSVPKKYYDQTLNVFVDKGGEGYKIIDGTTVTVPKKPFDKDAVSADYANYVITFKNKIGQSGTNVEFLVTSDGDVDKDNWATKESSDPLNHWTVGSSNNDEINTATSEDLRLLGGPEGGTFKVYAKCGDTVVTVLENVDLPAWGTSSYTDIERRHDNGAIKVKKGSAENGKIDVLVSRNEIPDDKIEDAFGNAEDADSYVEGKAFKTTLDDANEANVINDGIEMENAPYDFYVYARAQGVIDAANKIYTVSSEWVEYTVTIDAATTADTGEWDFTYKGKKVNNNLATYNDGVITFTNNTKDPDRAVLAPSTSAKNGLVIKTGTGVTAKISLNGVATPKTIVLGELKGTGLDIAPGNEDTIVIKTGKDGTKSIVGETGDATGAAGDSYTFATANTDLTASTAIKVAGKHFTAINQYEIIPDGSTIGAVAAGEGKLGDYEIKSGNTADVIVSGNDTIAKITVKKNDAQDGVDGLDATKVGESSATMGTVSVSFNAGKNIPAGTYDAYLVSNNIADAGKTSFTVAKDNKTDIIIDFKKLPENTEFNKIIISNNGAPDGSDSSAYTLGVYNSIPLTTIATKATAPVMSDFDITRAPKEVKISTNKAYLRAIILSGDAASRKLSENGYGDTVVNYAEVTSTATPFRAVVSATPGVEKAAIEENTEYWIYAGYTDKDGNKFVSDLVEVGSFRTPAQQAITPVLSVKDFTYLGAGIPISGNITAVSSPSATKGEIKVYAVKESDWEFSGKETANDLFEAAESGDNKDGWTEVSEPKYEKSDYGWPSGNYVAVAGYVPDDTDAGATYKAGDCDSDKFTIAAKTLYIQPKLVNFSSISTNTILGGKFDKTETFLYEIVDENGKVDSKAKCTDYKFYVDGKEIGKSTSFNTAGVKQVKVSANKATFTVEGDDKGSYELIDMDKSATFTVIEIDDLILSRTDKADKFYYEAYNALKTASDKDAKRKIITKYVNASMANVNITDFAELTYIYRNAKGELSYSESVPDSLSANDWLYISGNYALDDGSNIVADDYVALQVLPQPVVIIGTETVTSARMSDPVTVYKKNQGITVIYQTDEDKDKDGENDWKPVAGETFSKLNDVVKADADIDVSGIDTTVSGNYEDLTLTLDTASMNTTKFHNYTVDKAYLDTYQVTPAFNVIVKSAATGATISENMISGTKGSFDKTKIAISIDSVPNGGWSVAIGNGYDTELYKDLVTGALNGKNYELDLNGYLSSELYSPNRDIVIYAVYKASKAERTNASGMYWDLKNPTVFYNGGKFVSQYEDAKKSVNNVLELDLYRSTDSNETLTMGEDYKLSYKNNQKVGNAGDSKGPQIIVKGLGAYKDMKFTVPFTILPESFENAQISVKKKYVPVDGKKLKIGETVKVGSTKVGSKFYQLIYKDADTKNVLTEAQVLGVTTARKIEVYAKSVNTTNKVQTFTIGDTSTIPATIWVYPKNSKKMKVKLTGTAKGKYNVATTKALTPSVILKKGEIEITADKNTALSLEDGINATESKFYTNKELTKEAQLNDAGALANPGSYYLAVVPSSATMKKYSIFEPAAVKITYNGTKLTKKNVALAATKLPYTGYAADLTLVTALKSTDLDVIVYDSLGNEYVVQTLAATTNPVGLKFSYNDGKRELGKNSNTGKMEYYYNYDYNGDDYSKNTDKGKGRFNLMVVGKGTYEGKLKLSYAYEKGSIKSEKLEASMPAQTYNAAGYDESKISLKKNGADLTAAEKAQYTIKDVAWTTNGTGDTAGKGVITFENYKGTLNMTFKVTPANISTDKSIKVVAPSVLAKNASKSLVYLTQTYDDKTVTLKAGKDYIVSKPVANGTDQMTVTISVPEKGSGLTGGPITKSYYLYEDEIKDVKITALSANQGYKYEGKLNGFTNSSTLKKISLSGNGSYYQFEGRDVDNLVLPKVMEVTCTKGKDKNQVIDARYYTVSFKPAYETVKSSSGSSYKRITTGKYTVTITFKDDAATSKLYPSYTGASATYEVNQASN